MSCSFSSLRPPPDSTQALLENMAAQEAWYLAKYVHKCACDNMLGINLYQGASVSRASLGRGEHVGVIAAVRQMNPLTDILPKQWTLDMAFRFQDHLGTYGAWWQHFTVNTFGFSGAARHTIWNPQIWHATSLNPQPEPGSPEHSVI